MNDPGLAPESVTAALRELKRLDRLLPRPTIGQFCACMGSVAQRIVDRDLQLRRHSYLSNVLMKQYKRENEDLRRRVDELERELEDSKLEVKRRNATIAGLLHVRPRGRGANGGNDGGKAKEKKAGAKKRPRGAPKGHRGATRPTPDSFDKTETVSCPNACPECGGEVLPNGASDEVFIEEIMPVVRHVIRQILERGRCTCCGAEVRHPTACGPPVRTGPNVAALLSAMRQTMGVTFGKLATFSTESLGISLTPSGVLGITERMADRVRPVADGLLCPLRNKQWLNVDETGWPMNGQRWQMWGFFDERTAVYQAVPSRASKVIKDILGENFGGTVVSDFYAAYDFLKSTQRCLVHLLRDIRKELEVTPGNRYLKGLEKRCRKLIRIAAELSDTTMKKRLRKKKSRQAEKLLDEMLAAKPPRQHRPGDGIVVPAPALVEVRHDGTPQRVRRGPMLTPERPACQTAPPPGRGGKTGRPR